MNQIICKEYKLITKRNKINVIQLIYNLLFNITFKVHVLVRMMINSKNKIIKTIIYNRLQCKYSVWISPDVKIGENLHLMHHLGVVIGSGVKIGNNCIIYQQVTLGKSKNAFPIINDNVTIYTGAKVLGGVTIGANSIIGANSVVLTDIPKNSIAVGVPARVIKLSEVSKEEGEICQI